MMMMTKCTLVFCFFFQGAALRLPASGSEDATPKILFTVRTSPKLRYSSLLNAQMKTWMSDLSPEELLIVGTNAPKGMEARAQWINASECIDTHQGGPCKEMMQLAFASTLDIDWLWVLNDDHYAIKDAVQYKVRGYDPDVPQILGIPACRTENCKIGMCGGGGELISRGALKLMLENGEKSFKAEYEQTVPKCNMWGDISTSTVAKNHGVQLNTIRGVYGWRKNSSDIQNIIDRGVNMETSPLLFHYVSIVQMEEIHSLVKQHKEQIAKPDLLKDQSSAFTKAWQDAYDAEAATYVADQNSRRYALVEETTIHKS